MTDLLGCNHAIPIRASERAAGTAANTPPTEHHAVQLNRYLKAGLAFNASLGKALGACMVFVFTMALAISTAAANAPMRRIS